MAQTIKLKRSGTSGAAPTTSQLALGEVAINTYDGKLYIKKDDGTESIVEIGAGGSGSGLSSSFTLYEYTATASQTTFSGSDSNSNTLAYDTGTPSKALVYLNGVLLDDTTDYTATTGTSVVLTTGAAVDDLLQVAAYKSESSVALDIDLADNVKLKFGNDDDLEIYHNGSNSYIVENGTGDLFLGATNLRLTNGSVASTYLQGTDGGAVDIRHNNSVKLATTSTGVDVTGTATMDGLTVDGVISQSVTAGTVPFVIDTNITSNEGSVNIIEAKTVNNEKSTITLDRIGTTNTGLTFKTTNSSTLAQRLKISNEGDISFYEDTGTTAKLTWDASAESLNFADNGKAIFGVGSDLQIYHDGSNSYISDQGTGDLRIWADSPNIATANGNKIFFGNNGAAELYFTGGAKRLATTSTGIDVTGTATMDGLTVAGDVLVNRTSAFTNAAIEAQDDGNGEVLALNNNGTDGQFLRLYNSGSLIGGLGNNTSSVSSLNIYRGSTPAINIDNSTGDVQFFEDTGTTAKFHWDASDERLGIGTTTPQSKLDVKLGNNETASIGGTISVGTYAGLRFGYSEAGNSNYRHSAIVFERDDAAFGDARGNIHILNSPSGSASADLGDARLTILPSGNIGIGTTAPDTTLHVYNSNSGASPYQNGNGGVIIERNGRAALNFLTPNTQDAYIFFADPQSPNAGYVGYEHTNDLLAIKSAGYVKTMGSGLNISAGNLQMAGTEVIDSSRNITAGTISSGNITTSGYLRGPSTFTIDPSAHGDNTGTVVIAGNLQVDGTTTTINSTTLTVDDKNITLASGSTNAAAAANAGITVDCGSDADATLLYSDNSDSWNFNKEIRSTVGEFATYVNTARYLKYRSAYGAAAVADFEIKSDNNSAAIARITGTGTADIFQVYDGTSPVFSVVDGGRVGVGTATPHSTCSLEVYKDGADSVLRVHEDGGTHVAGLHLRSGGNDARIQLPNASTGLEIRTEGNLSSGDPAIKVISSGRAEFGYDVRVKEVGIDTTTTSTTATTQVAIDTFAAATFRSARYTIQVTNSTDSTYHITEVLLIHDGTTPQITEYGTIFTGSAEATFDADISSGNVRLLATPATTDSMTFKVVRHCITV